jgi:hypothetical protein
MEGIVLGILLTIAFYLIPTACFFATVFFGFKSIKSSEQNKDASVSKLLSFLFGGLFLFFAFVWPGDFSTFLQNTEFYVTIYMFQITLIPISILIFCFWYKKHQGNDLFIKLFISYGLIDFFVKAPRIVESIYKIATDDHRPHATGFSAYMSRYMIQINLVSTIILLLAIYSLFISIHYKKSYQEIKADEK